MGNRIMAKMSKISDSEYKEYAKNLELLKGEQKKFEYLVEKAVIGRGDGSKIDRLIKNLWMDMTTQTERWHLKTGCWFLPTST